MNQEKDKELLSHWVSYLLHIENLGYVTSFAFLSIVIGLSGLSIQYFLMGLIVEVYMLLNIIGFISIVILWLLSSKKTKISKAKYYLEKILKGELTDPKEISDYWFTPASNFWFYALSGFFIGIGIGIFILNNSYYLSSIIYIIVGIVLFILTALSEQKLKKEFDKMNGKEKRKKEMQKASDTANTMASTAKNIQNQVQKEIEDKKQICTYLQGIYDSSIQKAEMYNTFNPYVSTIDPYGWEQAQGSFKFDITQLGTLQKLDAEIKNDSKKQEEWKATICSGNIALQSSTVSVPLVFKPSIPPDIFAQVTQGITDTTPVYINDITTRLSQDFSQEVADEFNKIINDWNGSDAQGKPSKLNALRNFIINRLWQDLDPQYREFSETPWYERYKNKQFREQFTKTRFFILGHRDESILQTSTLIDIDAVCEGTADCYDQSSKIGHLRIDQISYMEKCYTEMISNLNRMLMLRHEYHQ